MQDGRIVEQGSFADLSSQDTWFSSFLSVFSDASHGLTNSSANSVSGAPVPDHKSDNVEKKANLATGVAKTMTEETRMTGHVGLPVYWSWAKAAGGIVVPVTLFVAFAVQPKPTVCLAGRVH
jgi:hypothetical protein